MGERRMVRQPDSVTLPPRRPPHKTTPCSSIAFDFSGSDVRYHVTFALCTAPAVFWDGHPAPTSTNPCLATLFACLYSSTSRLRQVENSTTFTARVTLSSHPGEKAMNYHIPLHLRSLPWNRRVSHTRRPCGLSKALSAASLYVVHLPRLHEAM